MSVRSPGLAAIWLTACAAALAGMGREAAAEVHRIPPGTAWDGIAAKARPGDEIVLEPGVHRPARIEDLAGEPGRPIVIRAGDASSLAEIRGGPHGLELVRPSHVEVRNLYLQESSGEGLVIVGGPDRPARGVLVRNCLLARCGVGGHRPAVRFEGVRGITLADSRVEDFESAAISIVDAREVRLERNQVAARSASPGKSGVEISGGSENLEIDQLVVGPSIATTFAIGTVAREPPAVTPTGPLATRITIRNVLADRNGVFALVGSARDIDIRRNTILEPLDTTLLVVPPPKGHPGPSAIRFRDNLVSWTPNTLKRFTGVGEGFDGPPDVEYGANLWHSAELPAARPLLGGWEGRVVEPQVIDLDPRFDNYWVPREPAAKRFGFEPPPRPEPPAGRPPESPSPAR